MKYINTKIEEITVMLFFEEASEVNVIETAKDFIATSGMDAIADKVMDDLVEIRWSREVVCKEVVSIYRLALESKKFKDVKIGALLSDFITVEENKINLIELDENEFLQNIK